MAGLCGECACICVWSHPQLSETRKLGDDPPLARERTAGWGSQALLWTHNNQQLKQFYFLTLIIPPNKNVTQKDIYKSTYMHRYIHFSRFILTIPIAVRYRFN